MVTAPQFGKSRLLQMNLEIRLFVNQLILKIYYCLLHLIQSLEIKFTL